MLFKKRDEWARPLADYDVIAALPDSVVENPLGLVEEREPRAEAAARKTDGAGPGPAAAGATPATAIQPDLSLAVAARALPAKLAPQLATLSAAAPAGPGAGSCPTGRRATMSAPLRGESHSHPSTFGPMR